MTLIIKSSALDLGHAVVRPFGASNDMPAARANAPEDSFDPAAEDFARRIVELEESRLAELAEARAEGAREALEERSGAEAAALAQLEEALGVALDAWSEQLRSVEASAIGIAKAVLEQVFADQADLPARIERAIRAQVRRLDGASVVRLRVSPEDFSDAAALAALAASVGCQAEIIADPRLESGGCLMDLALGQVDAGLPAQWARISKLLDRLELQEAGR